MVTRKVHVQYKILNQQKASFHCTTFLSRLTDISMQIYLCLINVKVCVRYISLC